VIGPIAHSLNTQKIREWCGAFEGTRLTQVQFDKVTIAPEALASFFKNIEQFKLKGDSKIQYIIFKGCTFSFDACRVLPSISSLPRSVKVVQLTHCSLDLSEESLQGLIANQPKLKVSK